MTTHRLHLSSAGLALALVSAAFAGDYTWNQTASKTWTNTSYWTLTAGSAGTNGALPGGSPDGSDNATFDSSIGAGAATINTTVTINDLDALIGTGVTQTISNPNSGNSGVLTLGGDLTKSGVGTLVIRNGTSNSLTLSVAGTTSVTAGTLTLGGGNNLIGNATLGAVSVSSGATLNLNATAPTLGAVTVDGALSLSEANTAFSSTSRTITAASLAGSGTITGNTAGTATGLAVALGLDGSASTAFSGTLSDGLNATVSLSKSGSGIQTLTSTQSYTGATSVTGGTLVIDGSVASSSLTTVSGAGILSGHGTVGALSILSGGTIAPGNSPGTLSAGNAAFGADGHYAFQISDATGTAGTDWDLLAITGTLTIDATAASPFIVDLSSLGLVNFDSGTSYSWLIASASSGISFGAGADITSFLVDTSGFTETFGGTFAVGLSGNNLNLNYTAASAVPEPATWSLVCGVIALAGATLIRRRRAAR